MKKYFPKYTNSKKLNWKQKKPCKESLYNPSTLHLFYKLEDYLKSKEMGLTGGGVCKSTFSVKKTIKKEMTKKTLLLLTSCFILKKEKKIKKSYQKIFTPKMDKCKLYPCYLNAFKKSAKSDYKIYQTTLLRMNKKTKSETFLEIWKKNSPKKI